MSRSIPLDFTAKASIAVCVSTASRLVAARLASGAPGSWWCKHRDRRGADSENKAMATKQTSKQAKTKAEVRVDRSANNRPVDNSEHEPRHRNRRARSHSGAVRTDRAEATGAAAPKANLNGSDGIHKPEQARSSSKPIAEQADLRTTGVSGAELPPATTKRAQLIGLLERPEGATVAEIGQRLGWLPHTVRAAITGLRKAGREVTRSRDADDRSVYRLAPVETAGER